MCESQLSQHNVENLKIAQPPCRAGKYNNTDN